MRIFEIQHNGQGEREWVSGNTLIEALTNYLSITGMNIEEFDDEDDIIELPKDKWKEFTVSDPENELPEITFEQWMKENKKPDIIAGTMYYE